MKKSIFLLALAFCVIGCKENTVQKSESVDNVDDNDFITIKEQGTFAVGGTVKKSEGIFDPIAHGAFNPTNQSTEGQTLHGDHASVLYQIPLKPRKLPLVFWHGYGQSMRTWQSTPDGREGFQSIFLKKNFRCIYWTNLDVDLQVKVWNQKK